MKETGGRCVIRARFYRLVTDSPDFPLLNGPYNLQEELKRSTGRFFLTTCLIFYFLSIPKKTFMTELRTSDTTVAAGCISSTEKNKSQIESSLLSSEQEENDVQQGSLFPFVTRITYRETSSNNWKESHWHDWHSDEKIGTITQWSRNLKFSSLLLAEKWSRLARQRVFPVSARTIEKDRDTDFSWRLTIQGDTASKSNETSSSPFWKEEKNSALKFPFGTLLC